MHNIKYLFFQMFGLCAENCQGTSGCCCLQQNTRNTEDRERSDFLLQHTESISKI